MERLWRQLETGTSAVETIDFISMGPNQVRAALVAIYEGVDVLYEATINIVDSALREAVFQRLQGRRLITGDPLQELPGTVQKLTAKFAIEDAAVRVVSALDHLANAHVRLAWEANAATPANLRASGFNPADVNQRTMWISAAQLRQGLERVENDDTSRFWLAIPSPAFLDCVRSDEHRRLREFRDEVVHRERPSYAELPGRGRASAWEGDTFHLEPEYYPQPPTLAERRQVVAAAAEQVLRYADTLWGSARNWLPTIGLSLMDRNGGLRLRGSTKDNCDPNTGEIILRENRDPARFLRMPAVVGGP